MVLILDHQVGLFQLVRDWDASLYRNNMIAHAALGKLFDIPVVMSTSAETGKPSLAGLIALRGEC
jgi:hypothetical protein